MGKFELLMLVLVFIVPAVIQALNRGRKQADMRRRQEQQRPRPMARAHPAQRPVQRPAQAGGDAVWKAPQSELDRFLREVTGQRRARPVAQRPAAQRPAARPAAQPPPRPSPPPARPALGEAVAQRQPEIHVGAKKKTAVEEYISQRSLSHVDEHVHQHLDGGLGGTMPTTAPPLEPAAQPAAELADTVARMFQGGDIRAAVVAAEIFGPPRARRQSYRLF